ncbi:MAG: DUF1641 domain-containing protein [Candidatus Nanopelagicales bacterium]
MSDSVTTQPPAQPLAEPAPVRPPLTVGALSPAAAAGGQDEVLARLEAMSAQMTAISEELAATRAAREQWRELAATLVPVSRGAMEVATRELEELSSDVSIDDVMRFARTAVRAVPEMEALVGQLGSISELGHEITSLSGAGVARLTDILQAAQDKGYFRFATAGAQMADTVVTAFTEEDLRALGDNVVTILHAVKDMTQPEVMALLSRTMVTVKQVEDAHVEPPSTFALLRSLRDPQTRRGLARVLSMLHAVGAEGAAADPTHDSGTTKPVGTTE